VSLVAEFATDNPDGLIDRLHQLVERYTLSTKTGMAAYTGFSPSEALLSYGRKVKRGEVDAGLYRKLNDENLRIIMEGRGITGAVAALPFATRYEEAVMLCDGTT
jgi:tRNA(Ile2) C34 agmatinyltransferase TiaS